MDLAAASFRSTRLRHPGGMAGSEAAGRRAVRRRARMARRASRRAVREVAARPPGRYRHDDLVPLTVLRKVSEPAPIVRPHIVRAKVVAQPWWSTVTLWVIGLCFVVVAIFVGIVAWIAVR